MNSLLIFRIAWRALAKNKMRAGLTVLGVVIGIAAVTTMVSLGQSAGALVQSQFEGLGTNVILVFPETQRRQGVSSNSIKLNARDAVAMGLECPSILAASPIVGAGGQVIYGSANASPNEMLGVGEDYLIVRNWGVRSGEFFTDRDVASANKVCVIGHTLVAKLFQTEDPIGSTIRVKNIPFRVVGVLDKKGANMVGQDQDNILLMPYTTVRKRLQGSEFDNVHAIMASARTMALMAQAQAETDQLLLERHRIQAGEPRDFKVANTTEIANVLGMITGTLTLMLSSIAGISLLVGGVGIMNIMLVSVTERTREIGIRKALGATAAQIRQQFLIEAIVICLLGGALGIVLGVLGGNGVARFVGSGSFLVPWVWMIVGLVICVGVGLASGYYPASKAAALDPIDSLRYE